MRNNTYIYLPLSEQQTAKVNLYRLNDFFTVVDAQVKHRTLELDCNLLWKTQSIAFRSIFLKLHGTRPVINHFLNLLYDFRGRFLEFRVNCYWCLYYWNCLFTFDLKKRPLFEDTSFNFGDCKILLAFLINLSPKPIILDLKVVACFMLQINLYLKETLVGWVDRGVLN